MRVFLLWSVLGSRRLGNFRLGVLLDAAMTYLFMSSAMAQCSYKYYLRE